MYHTPTQTLQSILVHPKDRSDKKDQCGILYHIECPDCSQTYIGETSRNLEKSIKEHQKEDPNVTAVEVHMHDNQHSFDWENVTILKKEEHFLKRKIKEGIAIHKLKPTMNRDAGLAPPLHLRPHLGT